MDWMGRNADIKDGDSFVTSRLWGEVVGGWWFGGDEDEVEVMLATRWRWWSVVAAAAAAVGGGVEMRDEEVMGSSKTWKGGKEESLGEDRKGCRKGKDIGEQRVGKV
ncbi:hypothetical protein Tco_1484473 [Tanacetum coccineum]